MSRRERFQTASEMRAALARFREASAELEAARRSAETSLDYERVEIDQNKPLVADDNVQFTVYTPRQIKPQETYTMLAFAHLSKKREGAPADEPDPVALMKDQAARILGNQQADYEDTKEESSQMVPREGELVFVPRAEGIAFIPPSRSFTWRKSVHREEFDLQASTDLDGQKVSGTLTVFLGSLVIAEVPLKFSIDSRAEPAAERVALETPQTGRRVRQIFASYSPRDERIVNELAQVAPIFGSQFITDRTHLMPGEDRSEGAKRLIGGADAFQLFWSSNSMRSPDVMQEIDYAISLNKKNFILPTYWEDPLPRSPHENLPREELERLHFFRIYPGSISPATNQTTAVNKSTGPVSASAQTLSTSASPTAVFEPPPGIVRCTRCHNTFDAGIKYCGRCGGEIFEPASRPRSDTLESAPAQPSVIPETIMAQRKVAAPLPSPVLPAARVADIPKRGVRWMPIYAGAAMVLLAMIMVPAWLLMNSGTKSNSANMPSLSRGQKGFTGAGAIEFVYIAPGKFMMGSEDRDSNELPVHQVTINHMFYLGKYEVTQAQWQAVMGNNPSNFKDCGGNCPVEQVTWIAAQDFIRKLNQMNDGYSYRLPSEAEWEYACRAGTSGEYPGDPKEMAWFGENAGGRTHPVGQKLPNAWGLYDITGNALEWCEDWYHSKYDGAPTDGSAWLNGGEQKYRIIRGGSWNSGTLGIRSATRGLLNPDGANSQFGFRVVAVPRTQ